MSIWDRELSDKVLSSAKFILDKPGLRDARGQHENQEYSARVLAKMFEV